MTALRAFSHHLHAVGQAPLPSLDEALRRVCREPQRRIDRFIQLALLGAARCAAKAVLDSDCALYLGSGIGPEGNNVLVQEQICRERLLPRPFNFVNTLGSSATYFVAKDRGLDAQGWWASRRGAALEAVLELALTDLELGLCSQALVGVVEECPAPYEDHRRRCQVPAAAALAEGSHWLLLARDAQAGDGALGLRWGEPGPGRAAGPRVGPRRHAGLRPLGAGIAASRCGQPRGRRSLRRGPALPRFPGCGAGHGLARHPGPGPPASHLRRS